MSQQKRALNKIPWDGKFWLHGVAYCRGVHILAVSSLMSQNPQGFGSLLNWSCQLCGLLRQPLPFVEISEVDELEGGDVNNI